MVHFWEAVKGRASSPKSTGSPKQRATYRRWQELEQKSPIGDFREAVKAGQLRFEEGKGSHASLLGSSERWKSLEENAPIGAFWEAAK
jgi:hypothetical protein